MACGGGGGSADISDTITPSIPIPLSDLQLVVPPPSYLTNTENVASFEAMNAFRSSLGLGLWAQNSKLDMAAQNHVNYEVLHHVFGHAEVLGLPGFTGVDATERAAYVGYMANWVGELGAGIGAEGVNALVNSVYHRSGLMNQSMSEVGIANSTDPTYQVQSISFSNALKTQHNAPDYVAVYPLDQQTNVPLTMVAETVDPFPTIASPSSPISFISAAGTKLEVIHFTVTAQGAVTPLSTQLITQDNDPNPGYLPSHEAYIVGMTPFSPNTVYNVSFVGAVNNVQINKEWSFTTASQ
jgi:uncharacterized protein YkwD